LVCFLLLYHFSQIETQLDILTKSSEASSQKAVAEICSVCFIFSLHCISFYYSSQRGFVIDTYLYYSACCYCYVLVILQLGKTIVALEVFICVFRKFVSELFSCSFLEISIFMSIFVKQESLRCEQSKAADLSGQVDRFLLENQVFSELCLYISLSACAHYSNHVSTCGQSLIFIIIIFITGFIHARLCLVILKVVQLRFFLN
jgi:hypothetical protein